MSVPLTNSEKQILFVFLLLNLVGIFYIIAIRLLEILGDTTNPFYQFTASLMPPNLVLGLSLMISSFVLFYWLIWTRYSGASLFPSIRRERQRRRAQISQTPVYDEDWFDVPLSDTESPSPQSSFPQHSPNITKTQESKPSTPASGVCNYCKKRVFLPYRCHRCQGLYCADHRFPETHDCLFK